jgi:hypothetical protein
MLAALHRELLAAQYGATSADPLEFRTGGGA